MDIQTKLRQITRVSRPYDILEHTHRFAAWAAATGASASPGCRFSVEVGKAVLEASGFDQNFLRPSDLPSPREMDKAHRKWRLRVISHARKRGLTFTHGIAAKLINLYLKCRFTLGGHAAHPKVASLHPPIDSLLLKAINTTLPRAQRVPSTWSKFDDKIYNRTVGLLREISKGQPFWTIEAHWKGHR